ncbi:MAG: hypothetical protein Ct9H300mP12_17290 [Acidimicrobiales bacterium]|nr:MAG: hypothetical protein Ct9H300mP12_17290 [Acidimicrobiales bacterium]
MPSGHEFLFHKTTVREVYTTPVPAFPERRTSALERGRRLTETTMGNLVVRLEAALTPPVRWPAPGDFRAQLLADGEVVEQVNRVRSGSGDGLDGQFRPGLGTGQPRLRRISSMSTGMS